MVNRLVLGAFDGTYALRVSRPGYDVLDTGLATTELAFDSRWSEMANVYQRGSFAAPTGFGVVTTYFGTTFATKPMVVAVAQDSSGYYFPVGFFLFNGSGPTYYYTQLELKVYTNRFEVYHRWSATNALTIHYVVMQNFYG